MNQKFVETTRCEIEIEVGLDRMQQNFEILFLYSRYYFKLLALFSVNFECSRLSVDLSGS